MGSEPLGSTEAVLQFAERVLPGGGATSIAAADVDGDGDLDVLLGNDGSPNRVLLNAGGGTFPTSITLPGGSARTRSIAAADVDGDGDLDVLLGNYNSPSRVLLNAGDGTFPTSIELSGGSAGTLSIAAADVDGDGDLDVLLGNNARNNVVLLNAGDGTFPMSIDLPGGSAYTRSIAAADVDGDGDIDVLLGDSLNGVLLSAGGGTFPTSIELPGGSAYTRSIAAADVDGDGDLDVLLGNYDSPSRALLNAGGGTFPTSIELSGGSADTRSIAAADVDGDGDLDVLLGNYNSPSRVLLNAGDGTFPTSVDLPGGSAYTHTIAAADVDGDGDLDVMLGNYNSPSRVLLNAGGGTFPTSIELPGGSADTRSIAAADVDGDGDLDVLLGSSGRPSRVLLNAGDGTFPMSIDLPGGSAYTRSIAAADVDGDGDLDVLLGNYDSPSRVLLNAGDGSFPTSLDLPGGSADTRSIAAADVDGDGDLDVLLGNEDSPSRVLPFTRCSKSGTARSRYGNGCVRCPAPSSRRDDVFDVCYECDEHSQLDPGSGACAACTEGSERFLGATRCTRCPVGKRHAATGTGCIPCSPGTFTSTSGSTACQPCTQGYLCVEGSSAPQPCPGGTHANQTVLTLTGYLGSLSECVVCPVGTSCSVGSTVAVPCAPGTYNNQSRQETCLKCAAGSFQNRTGQTSCSPCPAGYYCAEGAATPVPCPGGKYNNRTGLESEAGCVPVGFGYWAPTGSVFPIPCPSGFSCPGYFNDFNTSGSQPLILPMGGLTPLETVETQTVETITGSLSLNAPLSSFLSNASRQIQYRQTIAAQLGVPWQDLQLDFSAASPSPPAAGRRLQTGSTIVTYTFVRTVTTNPTTINATSNATTSGPPVVTPSFTLNNLNPEVLGAALGVSVANLVAPTATVVQQTATVIRPRPCPRGFWCTAGIEVPCEQGFYNPTTNAANAKACLRCPEFSTTSGNASTDVSQCVCEQSFVQQLNAAGNVSQCVCAAGRELVGGVRCDACKTGTYKDWTGENADRNPLGPQKCLECPVAGTTTVQEGADSVSQCVCKVGTFANLTSAEVMRATNDSSRVAADAFECKPCARIHSGPGEMTNCTAPGVTLDTIPVMPGHWRQNLRALYVRMCDLKEACLGGGLAGDASCADGHTGPLCDLCVKDPLHFGGRGEPCQSCSDAGDPMETIIFYIIGGVVVLLALVLATAFWKRRVAQVPAAPKKEEEAGVAKYQGAKHLAQKAVTEGVVKGMIQGSAGTITMTEANKLARLAAASASSVVDSLGVKIRILISLSQVVSQLDVIFDITYPAFYTATLEGLKNINIQVNLLPFGCVFPLLDNFFFDFVLKTATPLVLVLLLYVLSKVLRARFGDAEGAQRGFGAYLADACSDLWFFIIFLVYPSCSSITFMFFMRETYNQPGEVYMDLMRADRSIDREGELYQGFTVYAVVMLILYPIGVPLFYGLLFHLERHQLQEMRRIELSRETDFALAKLEAEAAATPEETDAMVRKAMEAHEATGKVLAKLRGELPTTQRKLTAGYELRMYWFEIFECVRKI
ncbi:protein serine threonine, partial [Chrysochromulina tobinii]